MRLKAVVKSGLERLLGARIFGTLPHGLDIFADIRASLPGLEIGTIFDVGANVGQSALHYVEAFPRAKIYCFEPVLDTFTRLGAALDGHPQVSTFRLALGESRGPGNMIVGQGSDLASLSQGTEAGGPTETVDVDTLDEFCAAQSIERINYLKVDTEGGDLAVLKGAVRMLADQRIDVLELEAGMNRLNTRHVPFATLETFLGERNYLLFGLYEQVLEWPTGSPNLRRANPVFVSGNLVKANRRP